MKKEVSENVSHKRTNVSGGGTLRKSYLDVAKLITVLCVVRSHASVVRLPIASIINIFFMPAFFIIYGMAVTEQSRQGEEWVKFLKRRTKSLLVPYVLWALIYSSRRDWIFWKNLFVGNNPALGRAETLMVLWFLPCMFIAVLLYQVYSNVYNAIKSKGMRREFIVVTLVVCAVVSQIFNGYKVGGRFFGWDIAFLGCLFMIIGSKVSNLMDKAKRLPVAAKFAVAIVGFVITYFIASVNMKYCTDQGGPVMALAIYGRIDLFIVGALIGTISVLLISMLFEKNMLLVWMGQFSLVIMAIHYMLFDFILPQCNKILNWDYGVCVQAELAAVCVFLVCLPICCVINWACPELNGKAVKMRCAKGKCEKNRRFFLRTIVGAISFMILFISMSLVSYGYMVARPKLLVETADASTPLSPMNEQSDVRQYFVTQEAAIAEIQVMVGTYMRMNHGSLIIGLYEADTDQKLMETAADISLFVDNQYCSIEVPKIDVHAGMEYYLRFYVERESEEDQLTIYRTAEDTANETGYAVIDGEVKNYNLCVKLYGFKP